MPASSVGVPHQFEQDALLRVHLRRLARRDPEKRRLEQIDIGDQPGRPCIALARLAIGRVIVEAGRPPASIDLGDRVGAGSEQFPERLQAGSARKPAGSPYDRDRSITHALRLIQCPCQGRWAGCWPCGLPFITHPLRKNQFAAASGVKPLRRGSPHPRFRRAPRRSILPPPGICGEPSGGPT